MSFQYINQYNLNNIYKQQIPNYVQSPIPVQYNYGFIPVQTSFYNQNLIYPYNPLFAPNLNANYQSLGTIKSSNGENVHLFQLKWAKSCNNAKA